MLLNLERICWTRAESRIATSLQKPFDEVSCFVAQLQSTVMIDQNFKATYVCRQRKTTLEDAVDRALLGVGKKRRATS